MYNCHAKTDVKYPNRYFKFKNSFWLMGTGVGYEFMAVFFIQDRHDIEQNIFSI